MRTGEEKRAGEGTERRKNEAERLKVSVYVIKFIVNTEFVDSDHVIIM